MEFSFNVRRKSQSPASEQNYRPNLRGSHRTKRRKYETNDDTEVELPLKVAHVSTNNSFDDNWWKTYFEQKLELERKRMDKEDERHKDRMNFQKMAIMLQERVEKVKVEAMNNLTNALLRLQDSGKL